MPGRGAGPAPATRRRSPRWGGGAPPPPPGIGIRPEKVELHGAGLEAGDLDRHPSHPDAAHESGRERDSRRLRQLRVEVRRWAEYRHALGVHAVGVFAPEDEPSRTPAACAQRTAESRAENITPRFESGMIEEVRLESLRFLENLSHRSPADR
jgi:hypothetical protein